MIRLSLWMAAAIVLLVAPLKAKAPNILFILADDLGYGDLSCYNPEAKVQTRHLDQLAEEGMRFTDAHSPSTVCTPSRYSLLTGRMAFRTGFRSVFTGVGGPCLIEEGRLSLAGMLSEKGYATALFGKWHVGMTFYDKEGAPINQGGLEGVERIDYSRAITGSPIHRGFDEFFGTVSCPTTDWLYAFVDGDRVPVPPTGLLDKSTVPDHFYARDNRQGVIAPDFDLEEVDITFLEKSEDFLERHVKERPEKPFFLVHSTQAVHLPSFAAQQFQGKSKAGPHGDFIHHFDEIVGRLMGKLDKLGVADNTLVMVSSDNGPELPTVQDMRQTYGHDGARPWRGVKRDNWEGGHRVPFLVRWPGKVKPGSESAQVVSLTDIMATCAEIVGYELPKDAAEDSVSILEVFTGAQPEGTPVREYPVQEAIRGFSIRHGKWKFLDHKGSGGNRYEKKGYWGAAMFALPEAEPDSPGQLYDLVADPGETTNIYSKHPAVVKLLKAKLEEIKDAGRSAPWPRN